MPEILLKIINLSIRFWGFLKEFFLKKMVSEKTPNFLSKRVQTHKQSLNNMYNSFFLIDSHII